LSRKYSPFGGFFAIIWTMSIPTLKFAVYYGTITLNDGTTHTYTADDIATLYNVDDQPYLAVSLVGNEPFMNGQEYVSYVHLKPLANGKYYDAKERYNFNNEIQWGDDFITGRGKWAIRPTAGF
jgi:hypothetical protein